MHKDIADRSMALGRRTQLAVTMDLGTSLVTDFGSPTCVARELALRLVPDGIEILLDACPEVAFSADWPSVFKDRMFLDTDHELPYDPGMRGLLHDPALDNLRLVNLDIVDWFTPLNGRRVNPYAYDGGLR